MILKYGGYQFDANAVQAVAVDWDGTVKPLDVIQCGPVQSVGFVAPEGRVVDYVTIINADGSVSYKRESELADEPTIVE